MVIYSDSSDHVVAVYNWDLSFLMWLSMKSTLEVERESLTGRCNKKDEICMHHPNNHNNK